MEQLATARRPRRLGKRSRRAVLITHIAAAGSWLGMDVVMGALVLTAATTESLQTRAVAFRALEMFALVPLVTVALLTLISGVLLGLGSKYGVLRYWWVATKLVLTLVLTTLTVVALRPGVVDAADRGGDFLAGGAPDLAVGQLIFPPIVSTTAVLAAMVLSVVKPWGRTGRNRATPGGARTSGPAASRDAPKDQRRADDPRARAEQPGSTSRRPVRT
ncbi:hypothetical protein GCM10023169_37890 [Georgenia halophila]|uniref:DUF2269 domain-containing protein n=1 Tax=Georgenia halophila TaxID=620889 RepID=A0ABP8LMJ3_9MICO